MVIYLILQSFKHLRSQKWSNQWIIWSLDFPHNRYFPLEYQKATFTFNLKKRNLLKTNSPFIKLQLQLLVKGEEKKRYQATNVNLLGKKQREY